MIVSSKFQQLVLLVGTELQHVTAQLALEVAEATAPYVGTQLKLRDDLFWFGKPRVLWWLIQFISFQVMRLADMNNVMPCFLYGYLFPHFNTCSCFPECL
jgi:hypothetical protein